MLDSFPLELLSTIFSFVPRSWKALCNHSCWRDYHQHLSAATRQTHIFYLQWLTYHRLYTQYKLEAYHKSQWLILEKQKTRYRSQKELDRFQRLWETTENEIHGLRLDMNRWFQKKTKIASILRYKHGFLETRYQQCFGEKKNESLSLRS